MIEKRSEMTARRRAEFEASDAEHLACFEGRTRESEERRIAAERALEESLTDGEEIVYPPDVKPADIIRGGIVRTKRHSRLF